MIRLWGCVHSVPRIFLPLLALLWMMTVAEKAHANMSYIGSWSCHMWSSYAKKFVQSDGRVAEHSQKGRTTSEGQAYALFFALINNDKSKFHHILNWTENNLAQGDLHQNLPAWLWGEGQDKQWHILDESPASDADLWLGYTLIQAGRLWHDDQLKRLGNDVVRNIEQQEISRLEGVGVFVLSTKANILAEDKVWRLNLSYTPLHILRFLSIYRSDHRWQEILQTTENLLEQYTDQGLVPDWIDYDRHQKKTYVSDDAVLGYESIRVYLWAGMLNKDDELRASVMRNLYAVSLYLGEHQYMSDKVSIKHHMISNTQPLGFTAAMLPLLKINDSLKLYKQHMQRLKKNMRRCILGKPALYYDNSLAMFSLGWIKGVFSFGLAGELKVSW